MNGGNDMEDRLESYCVKFIDGKRQCVNTFWGTDQVTAYIESANWAADNNMCESFTEYLVIGFLDHLQNSYSAADIASELDIYAAYKQYDTDYDDSLVYNEALKSELEALRRCRTSLLASRDEEKAKVKLYASKQTNARRILDGYVKHNGHNLSGCAAKRDECDARMNGFDSAITASGKKMVIIQKELEIVTKEWLMWRQLTTYQSDLILLEATKLRLRMAYIKLGKKNDFVLDDIDKGHRDVIEGGLHSVFEALLFSLMSDGIEQVASFNESGDLISVMTPDEIVDAAMIVY
jgi:molybdopterin-guanine dinucleotide biosynthesis protein